MAVPVFQDFTRPLLELLNANGPMRARDVYAALADALNLSETDRAQLIPSGKQPTYKNRIGWASTYLRFAELVHAPSRGVWAITDSGRKLLARHKGRIDLKVLETIPAFNERGTAKADVDANAEPDDHAPEPAAVTESTPQEQLDAAHAKIVGSVAEELSGLLDKCDPTFFEELVVDLLGRMGYGTSAESRLRVGRSGDGGIDGVISLDRLGLEKIYIQAKKWARDRRVGRPEIQAFFGALAGQRATKGLFMTTAGFTREAEEYAANVSGSLILVDGKRLVSLMIEHGVGVAVASTLTVPKVDYDYFEG